ncbi:DUF397 domain-containing protein [Actinoplanes missouriensis]|nr:DUF397 domain-containing protein [Actinoplanes missouriensis]
MMMKTKDWGGSTMHDTTTEWRRSSFCADTSCVEVAGSGDSVLIRDGKRRDQGEHLEFSKEDWAGFLRDIEGGRYAGL